MNPRMITKGLKNGTALLILVLTACAAAWAHPGHGETEGYSLLHYFSEPFHVIPMAAVIVASVLIFLFIYSRRKKRYVAEG
ncbi:MAG: hypothetical protein R6U28_06920 [Cyclonatronaceae bacterium]